MTKKLMSKAFYLALIPFILVVLMYELLPLFHTILCGFMTKDQSAFTLINFQNIFSKTIYRQAIVNSVLISLASAAIGMVLAFIAANAAHNASPRWKSFFTMLLNMMSNFSGVPLAFGFMLLLGNSGFLRLMGQAMHFGLLADYDLYSFNGLLMVYIYFQIPLATLLMIPSFTALKKEWRDCAELMGAHSLDYWGRVGVPVLLPSIFGTLGVLFSNALAAYATAYALFLNNFALLPLQITKQYKGDVTIDKATGGALCFVLIAIMLVATGINNYLAKHMTKGGTR